MTEEKFRISNSREEIIQVLKDKFQKNASFTVWQKDPDSEKRYFVVKAHLESLDSLEGKFSVYITDDDRQKFNHALHTYFLLDGQDFVFKTKLSIVQIRDKNILTFTAPKSVRLIEKRVAERKYFDEKVLFNVNVTFPNINSRSETDIKAICRVYNISTSGICIIVTKETFQEINQKKEIVIEGLNFFEHIGDVKTAIIRNARIFMKPTIKSDELFAIGLEFRP